MYADAAVDGLQALDGLERRTGGIFHGLFHGHGATDSPGGIDAGALGFIGKADEVGIRVTVEQTDITETRTLAVGQINHRVILGHRNHTGTQNHQIRLDLKLFAQQGVFGVNDHAVTILGHAHHGAFGHENARILLQPL
jgi:hypothetical protein